MTKTTVRNTYRGFDRYDLEGDLETVVKKLQTILEEHLDKKLELEIDYSTGYYDSVELSAEIYWMAEETDAQYALRLKNEADYQQRNEAYRRQQYEQLKREFG